MPHGYTLKILCLSENVLWGNQLRSYSQYYCYRFGFSSAINLYSTFGFDCTGTESTILQCQDAPSVCVTDSAAHAIGIICGGTAGEGSYIFISKKGIHNMA